MTSKRPPSPGLIPNPFIKKRNLEWSLDVPGPQPEKQTQDEPSATTPTAAAIESGTASIADHAAHFSALLAKATLSPFPPGAPRLPVATYRSLYESCLGAARGAHFVIHQHDHPVAGPHYDLRLQVNASSSASWAVMYGMPGDANSARLGRNATETRVHCLWNHLVEAGSRATGSLVIWDTGRYEVLRRRSKHAPAVDPDSGGEGEDDDDEEKEDRRTEQEKLEAAFRDRKIRVRLHGGRLPRGYVLNLRLTKGEDREGREKASRAAQNGPRRRRRRGVKEEVVIETSEEGESSEEEDMLEDAEVKTEDPSRPIQDQGDQGPANMSQAMRQELEELENAHVRTTNAYPGAENTIGSVHQRRWYLSMDRAASGFVKRPGRKGTKPRWEVEDGEAQAQQGGDGRLTYPFYVRGPDVERSLITGRLGREVLRDEGVTDFNGRKGWRPVLR
ncbi:hypothetical protein ACHAQA_000423 [Verticillium albo-atrum]